MGARPARPLGVVAPNRRRKGDLWLRDGTAVRPRCSHREDHLADRGGRCDKGSAGSGIRDSLRGGVRWNTQGRRPDRRQRGLERRLTVRGAAQFRELLRDPSGGVRQDLRRQYRWAPGMEPVDGRLCVRRRSGGGYPPDRALYLLRVLRRPVLLTRRPHGRGQLAETGRRGGFRCGEPDRRNALRLQPPQDDHARAECEDREPELRVS